MILKYKYHSDSCLLEAYRSYTLAQNNSMSDTIVITSTAPDAERYNYCLEFICYNSKSIPKAQYISPILTYNDGISFVVPNNLTEFRGHVDMQLTGYDPDDNSIVFKSVSKNCKAFDVEGSLCVLEKDLNDTPNVFTEVLKQLEELGKIKQDMIDEAMVEFGAQIFDKVAQFRWCNVKFYDNGELLENQWVVVGSKLTPPSYTLPENCVIVGSGWYNPATESLWDMDEDTVSGSMELYLNYMTDDVEIREGVVRSLGRHTRSHIYIPEYYDGYAVREIGSECYSAPYESRIHFGNNMENIEILPFCQNIYGVYFPSTNQYWDNDASGVLYAKEEGVSVLMYVPDLDWQDTVYVKDGCLMIYSFAIGGVKNLHRLILPDSLQYIAEYGIAGTEIETLQLPPNLHTIEDNAVYCNPNLKAIILEGDCSESLTNESFVNVDINNVVTRPTLYVYPQYYENYKSRGLEYDIQVIGQDYYDGIYAHKGV